jgi:hypothetical protein
MIDGDVIDGGSVDKSSVHVGAGEQDWHPLAAG